MAAAVVLGEEWRAASLRSVRRRVSSGSEWEPLGEADAALEDVVRTRVFLVDAADGDAVAAVHGEIFGEIRPASGFIVVSGFLDPRWKLEIEADAIIAGA